MWVVAQLMMITDNMDDKLRKAGGRYGGDPF
jgi:hypothetical protein